VIGDVATVGGWRVAHVVLMVDVVVIGVWSTAISIS